MNDLETAIKAVQLYAEMLRNVQIEPPSRLLAKVGSNAGLGVSPREEQDGNV